jgi:hypothetical protein
MPRIATGGGVEDGADAAELVRGVDFPVGVGDGGGVAGTTGNALAVGAVEEGGADASATAQMPSLL